MIEIVSDHFDEKWAERILGHAAILHASRHAFYEDQVCAEASEDVLRLLKSSFEHGLDGWRIDDDDVSVIREKIRESFFGGVDMRSLPYRGMMTRVNEGVGKPEGRSVMKPVYPFEFQVCRPRSATLIDVSLRWFRFLIWRRVGSLRPSYDKDAWGASGWRILWVGPLWIEWQHTERDQQ